MHREVSKGIYYVGVDDHHTELFESLWPLPHGVSYNSYLVVGDKIALIETVKNAWADEWIANIREVVDPAKIDYIVMNHMEPDHTGALPDIAALARNATMIYTQRASEMQKSFYDVPLKERVVKDLEEIPLGGKTLKFVHAQFLHWPE
ncbi:MAG: FprA family A-type flavoprotein, partial [Candidatus Thorarchaeota archaeon]